jgi:hypothetical protein
MSKGPDGYRALCSQTIPHWKAIFAEGRIKLQ